MKTKRQKSNLGKVVLLGATIFTFGLMVACDSSGDDAEDTTDNDVVDTDSSDVIDEPIDTFTVAPDVDTIVEEDILEDEEIEESYPE